MFDHLKAPPLSDQPIVPELFAGPGGWSTALRLTGYSGRSVGVEWDPSACATATAAGHERVQADVSRVDPVRFVGGAPVPGLIGSPPCTTFSNAGHGAGRRLLELLATAITRAARGEFHVGDVRRRAARILRGVAARTMPKARRSVRHRWAWEQAVMAVLVVEPMRWVHALRPGWVALEQVPSVLPLWTHMVAVLRGLGYTGGAWVLSAEEYGVPQTRKRAILLASRHGRVLRPTPTHQPYRAGRAPQVEPDLFGDPLPPPVSMAAALGWADDTEVVSNYSTGGDTANPGRRLAAAPAFAVTPKVDRNRVLRVNDTTKGTERRADEPAPTVFCSRPGSLRWVETGNNSHVTGRTGSRAGDGDVQPYQRSVEAPAPTLDTNVGAKWRVRTSYGTPADTPKNRSGGERQFKTDAVRVTVAEAGILQSFPPDYPWQGTRTAQYRQVGDSVPPLLGAHCLHAVIPADQLPAQGAA